MLRVALRRVLWAIPTLFGISLVVFLVTTLIPDPAASVFSAQPDARDRPATSILAARRRAHFLDLPRFINPRPDDVRSKAEADVAAIVGGVHRLADGDSPGAE